MIADAELSLSGFAGHDARTPDSIRRRAQIAASPPARFQMGRNTTVAGNSLGSLPDFDQIDGPTEPRPAPADGKAGMEEHRIASRRHPTRRS